MRNAKDEYAPNAVAPHFERIEMGHRGANGWRGHIVRNPRLGLAEWTTSGNMAHVHSARDERTGARSRQLGRLHARGGCDLRQRTDRGGPETASGRTDVTQPIF